MASLASVAVAWASCRMVKALYPCPMPMDGVSPGYHGCLKRCCFQVDEGSSPGCSSGRSMPVSWPKPQGFMKS